MKGKLCLKDYIQCVSTKQSRKLNKATPKNKMYGGSGTLSTAEKSSNNEGNGEGAMAESLLQQVIREMEDVEDTRDPEDKVSMDVAFFIRFLELVRENVNDDATLHRVADKVIEKSRDGYVVTMDDYEEIEDTEGVYMDDHEEMPDEEECEMSM